MIAGARKPRRWHGLGADETCDIVAEYVVQERAVTEISKQCGMSCHMVHKHLCEHGIRLRSSAEQRYCDRKHGRYNHAAAIHAAWERGQYATARYQETRPTGDWGIERHGANNSFYGKHHTVESRSKISAAAKERVLPGKGSYGKEWTAALRAKIVARDGHCCRICGASDTMLQVHHVDQDRTNSAEENLLTVCAACHLAHHGLGTLQSEMLSAARDIHEESRNE